MGVAWNGNNIGGSTKRAVGIAMHVGFGNLGGVISGFSFRAKDAPRYFSGHGLLIGTVSMSFLLSLFMHLYLKKENARRDAAMQSQGLTLESYTEDMKHSEREKGDNATVCFLLSIAAAHELIILMVVLPLYRLTTSVMLWRFAVRS
jgi:hypothetical protein